MECIFLGYPAGQKGHIVQDLKTKRVFVSRGCTFDETVFPYHERDFRPPKLTPPVETGEPDRNPPPDSSLYDDESSEDEAPSQEEDQHGLEEDHADDAEAASESAAAHSRPKRIRSRPASYMHEQEDELLRKRHRALAAFQVEPVTETEALADEEWRQAMDREFELHKRNNTWKLVDPLKATASSMESGASG